MINEIRVGPQVLGDGALITARGDKSGAIVSTNAHTFYGEMTMRGGVMVASNAVAGIAPGTAFSAAPPLALWNPPSSGRILVVLKTSVGLVGGTLGGGNFSYGVVPSQTTIPTTGAELVPVNTLLGFPRGVGRAFAGSTFVAAPTILRPAFTTGAFLNTTALMPQTCVDIVDGEFAVAQGAAFVIQGVAAAGTSPLVMFSFTWEEIPV
jgi:hypothetical protein